MGDPTKRVTKMVIQVWREDGKASLDGEGTPQNPIEIDELYNLTAVEGESFGEEVAELASIAAVGRLDLWEARVEVLLKKQAVVAGEKRRVAAAQEQARLRVEEAKKRAAGGTKE